MASVASTEIDYYTYRAVNSTDEEIRLVTIKAGSGPEPVQCILTHTSLRDLPRYEALSYVWGDSAVREEIVLDGFNFSVTRNLGQALWYLRLPDEDRTFWIDAVCINQQDVTERSEQVQLMRRIYRDAQQVVSWIDEGKLQAADAAEAISESRHHGFSKDWAREMLLVGGSEPTKLFHVIFMLTRDCENWRRLWITQEVALARKGIVQCKGVTIPYEDLRSFSRMFLGAVEPSVLMLERIDIGDYMMISNIAEEAASGDIGKGNTQGTDLLVLLEENRYKKATDPRDMVYGLFGLANVDSNSHDGLRVDYSEQWTKVDVYTGVVRAMIETTSKLDVICSSFLTSKNKQAQRNINDNLPSWVPDWSIGSEANYANVNKSKAGAAGETLASAGFLSNGKILSVAGVCVGTVYKLGRTVPEFTIQEARHNLDEYKTILVDWYKLIQCVDDSSFASVDLFSRTLLYGQGGNERLTMILLTELHSDLEFRYPTPEGRELLRCIAIGLLRSLGGGVLSLIEPTKNDPSAKIHELPIMGLGPGVIEEHDMACVFLGCRDPVVIRPDGDRFIFVSAVYVDNLMDGQAMKDLDDGFYDLMTFELH